MKTAFAFASASLVLISLAACGSPRENSAARSRASVLATVDRIAALDAALAALVRADVTSFQRDDEAGAAPRFVSRGWRGTRDQRWDDLGARAPETAAGAMRVGVSRFERLSLDVTLVGARASAAQLDEGRIAYRNVFDGVDRVVASSSTVLEDLLLLEGSSAPSTFTWHVDRGAGIARVTPERGGLAFYDDRGRAVIALHAPYLIDATGARRDASVVWNEGTSDVTVSGDTRGLTFPVALDPTLSLGNWYDVPLRAARLPRQGQAMAYDPVHDRIVMFGGRSDHVLGDTWLWNGADWAEVKPATNPPPRSDTAMAYDAARQRIVLFGGGSGGPSTNDTWTWDGTNWTAAAPMQSPPGRYQHSMTYDAARQRVVLFGGESNSGPLGDTWTWDGTNWTRAASTGPSGRYGLAMAYDATRQYVMGFGGRNDTSNALSDTWRWDGTVWTQLTPTTLPSARTSASMAFDAVTNQVLMFGGENNSTGAVLSECHRWTGTNWSACNQGPPARAHASLAFDSTRNQTVLFGGMRSDPRGDTFTFNGTNWTERGLLDSPSARGLPAMAFDAARGNIVLFGGVADNVFTNETWTWDGMAWTRRTPATVPTGRASHGMAYDAARARIVMFGGTNSNDVFTWDGTNWTQLTRAIAPLARRGFGFAYDAAHQYVLLFGGVSVTPGPTLGDTWTWDGSAWTQLYPATSPEGRSTQAMAFDGGRSRVTLFGGIGTNFYGDTWTWDGTTWAQARPADSPPGLIGSTMTYDAAHDQLVMFGDTVDLDTWTYNGNWSHLTTPAAPATRQNAAIAYDGARKEVVLFGGRGATSYADTWRLLYAGAACGGVTGSACEGGLACIDGVCCEDSCGTCQTCGGFAPGRCTPVANREDPDSCATADGKSCSAKGVCQKGPGTTATSASECASGFVADGVCCNQACNDPCMACRADLKESGTLSGVCDYARNGSDPHDSCAENTTDACQADGMCDGRGACRLRVRNSPCGAVTCVDERATSRVCDGQGTCSASEVGVPCGFYACATDSGCKATCASNVDCAARTHCTSGSCEADEGGSCDGDHTILTPGGAPLDCGVYKCAGSSCRTSCTRITDCANGASCDAKSHCIASVPRDDSGASDGCSTSPRNRAPTVWTFALAAFAVSAVRRRRRMTEKST